MSAFDAIAESGALEPIDLHFARLLRRLADRGSADVVALTAALLSRQRCRGHSCVDPGDWAGRPFPAEVGAALPPLPDLASWQRALERSTLVSDGDKPTPLVRDAAGRLYLSRYWHAEQRLARHLRERLESAPPAACAQAFSSLFRQLFGEPEKASTDPQALAAATALASRVTLISGGPGTGKTTTVGRMLALLLTADPELRIALAAPTGKAAARLGEAVAEQVEQLPIDDRLRALLPSTASTIHRLLGYQPRRDRFRHHARRPLALDVLVIDEVSMVDLLLMDATISALPPGARVVLLGDKDQLTSVETGSVFGDLCAAAGLDRTTSHDRATQGSSDRATRASPLLRGATVELVTSYRFRDQPGIGELAVAVRQGDAGRTIAVLDDARRGEVSRLEPPDDADSVLAPVKGLIDSYLAAASPAEALERLGRFRVLCARRRGSWGVERMNAAVERHLAAAGHQVTEGFYPARPILITANDYSSRLFNGDLGICWRDGRLWAFFPGTGAEPRRLPLARLPAHETAWAMTVHKAQGSEFDRVLLVLGGTDSRATSRELLYTGATRARRSVVVVGTTEVIRGAVARRSRRVSGLADALRGVPRRSPSGGMPNLSPSGGTLAEPPAPEPEPAPAEDPETPDGKGQGQMSLFT